jgi:hypothetical protein
MIDETTKFIKGSLRYKSAPETNYTLNVPLTQTQEELVEFDRNVDISLEQVYSEERQKSTIFRPTTKFTILFKNEYIGKTNYGPFKNNLYYTNAIENTKSTFPGGNFPPPGVPNTNISWEGKPQYFEFDFIRIDNNIPGYTQPPNNHINFLNKNATTYNWTHYLTYAYDNDFNKQLHIVDQKSNATWSWVAQDGLPFYILIGSNNNSTEISFKSPVKHGLNVGEYIKLSINYNGQQYFQISSIGGSGFGSDEYIFNIDNVGYLGTTFNKNVTGTFKRVINISNKEETTSKYYVRKHKVLTNVEDAVLVKAGFEQNIYGNITKLEKSVLTPNSTTRTSVIEGSQAYTLTFNTDIDLQPLLDNQKRPVSELFFTTIWKGSFGWTKNTKQGWDFNLPLNFNLPNPWWQDSNTSNLFNITQLQFNSNTLPPQGPFYYNDNLNINDTLDGDFCEWNDYDQIERVISRYNHKITYNKDWFSIKTKAQQTNQFGYYYKPHNPIKLRVYSDYVEESIYENTADVPNYAFYSNLSNGFRWRDIYEYGYIDQNGLGVNYPFTNGKHYPYTNTIFRIIPEGIDVQNITEIAEPIVDGCE